MLPASRMNRQTVLKRVKGDEFVPRERSMSEHRRPRYTRANTDGVLRRRAKRVRRTRPDRRLGGNGNINV